jgi:hypothetical protein
LHSGQNTAAQQSHVHHYVPQWYQKRFLLAGNSELHYLNLHPKEVRVSPTKSYTAPPHRRKPPSRCFFEKDLYMLRFGKETTDWIEKRFFGDIDTKGSLGVDVFSRINGFTRELVKAHEVLVPYMGAQRFRTPRGLDWLKAKTGTSDHNRALMIMGQLFQQHTTMWGEGVWEIVRAAASPTKFISDEPVTFYNQKLPPSKSKYPGTEELDLVGTRTLFPLGPESCLIITHVQFVRNAQCKPLQPRENARQFEPTLMYMGNVQYGRELDEDEVLRLNLLMKSKATRYIAAGKSEWLYPEKRLKKTGWATLDDDWFLLPNPWKVGFTSSIVVGYRDGSGWAMDEYGRQPGDPKYRDERRREREWQTHTWTKHTWAKKRAGKSLSHIYEAREDQAHDSLMKDFLESIKPKHQSN